MSDNISLVWPYTLTGENKNIYEKGRYLVITEKRIYLSSPHLGEKEYDYVKEAFDTNWIAPVGPNIELFEKEFCEVTGAKYAAALSSGTAAIHLALVLLGVSRGDEVLCSTFTFAASANPIVYQSAVPVFVDSEVSTWNMDAGYLQEAIQDRIKKGKIPKAVVLVHLYGQSADIDPILDLCNHYNIPLIEDHHFAHCNLSAESERTQIDNLDNFSIRCP